MSPLSQILGSAGMGVGLAYGHIGSQGIDDIIHGSSISDTVMYTFGPTLIGTGIGFGLSKRGDPKNQGLYIVGGTLLGAIGSSIYLTVKDEKENKKKFNKNMNFYMTIILALIGATIFALSKDTQLGKNVVNEARASWTTSLMKE